MIIAMILSLIVQAGLGETEYDSRIGSETFSYLISYHIAIVSLYSGLCLRAKRNPQSQEVPDSEEQLRVSVTLSLH